MKFKKISILLLVTVSSFMFQVSRADESKNTPTNQRTNEPTHKMLFWYPGEAGTTEEAQTTLDAFFDYVNAKVAPDKIAGKYFNSVEGGAAFIKQAKPKFGIISFAAYQMNGASLGQNTVLMQTLPLPDGKPVERYVVMGKGAAPKDWATVMLYSKQPLTAAFVEKYILPFKAKGVQTVGNILPALKDIAAGTKAGGVILQPIEHFTLKNMQQPWVKELSVWHVSNEMPSAPLVIFGYVAQDFSPANIGRPPATTALAGREGLRYKFGTDNPFMQRFKATLLNMASDPQGKEIMEMLRLKGFSTP